MHDSSLPSSSKDIRQLADHKEDDSTQYDICQRYPVDIGRWTNVFIDLSQDRCNKTVAYDCVSVRAAWFHAQIVVIVVNAYLRYHP
jgi:hypothetical protein